MFELSEKHMVDRSILKCDNIHYTPQTIQQCK